jgi:hypothetical protein
VVVTVTARERERRAAQAHAPLKEETLAGQTVRFGVSTAEPVCMDAVGAVRGAPPERAGHARHRDERLADSREVLIVNEFHLASSSKGLAVDVEKPENLN